MDDFSWMTIMDPILFCLKIIGLWPDTHSYVCNNYTLYAIVCVPLFMFANAFFQVVNMFVVEMDLDVLAGALFVIGDVLAVMKICVFVKNLQIIKNILVKINGKVFQPKSHNQVKIIEPDLRLWMMFYRGYQVGVFSMCVFWLFRPILDGSYKKKELPFFAWYPFDVTKSPIYEITYVYQIVGLFFISMAQFNLDSIFIALTVYMGAQCDLLCDNLKGIDKRGDLVKCIQHHQEILRLSEELNQFFGNLILLQFFTSASTNALGLFKLSLAASGSSEFYTLIALSWVVTTEIFLYCWYGNQVDFKSKRISWAAFESNWVGSPISSQKMLMFFLMRSQRSITITVYNLFPLSLRTFMTIMRTSWSYFAVLRQLNTAQM